MGYDYALVHLKYTIPPALLLGFLYRPLCSRIDIYKIVFLITVAVLSTIPWDSYLIRHQVWTYPPDVIVGPKLYDIPAEEVFFFVIQTLNTSLLYLFLSKPTFHPSFLRSEQRLGNLKNVRTAVQILLLLGLAVSGLLIRHNGKGTYFGLIFAWAGPFLLLLWTLGYQFLTGLPWTNTVLPIALPTVYLWIVDTLALRRGTWVIEKATKLGVDLWPGLEIEEAFFFLVTNCLIVFGMVAFDNALAVLYTLTPDTQRIPGLPSPLLLISALLKPASTYDEQRIVGLSEAISRLQRKSRSFYVASGVFSGKLRIDLILLYSFCRVADDLVDNASSSAEAKEWIAKLQKYLHLTYDWKNEREAISSFVEKTFPAEARSALVLLPTQHLSREPLFELLQGFEMDLKFNKSDGKYDGPIDTEEDLEVYSHRVAGTVAHLCIDLVFHHLQTELGQDRRQSVIKAGEDMGIALQLVNISRDIAVDAEMKRVYIPNSWLQAVNLTAQEVINTPTGPRIDQLKQRLLAKAFSVYNDSIQAIEQLPEQARGPMRVAVESYMEIGRVLQGSDYPLRRGKATVPKWRRIMVAWRALNGPKSCATTAPEKL